MEMINNILKKSNLRMKKTRKNIVYTYLECVHFLINKLHHSNKYKRFLLVEYEKTTIKVVRTTNLYFAVIIASICLSNSYFY